MSNDLSPQTEQNPASRTENGRQTSPELRYVTPRATVYETPDAVLLELEMPGVSRDSIDITLERDELTITGQRRTENFDGAEVLHRERLPYSFRRSFVLSDSIDGARITARCENGILFLNLPKSEDLKPRKIAID